MSRVRTSSLAPISEYNLYRFEGLLYGIGAIRQRIINRDHVRIGLAAVIAVGAGFILLRLIPDAELKVLAWAAAQVAGLFSGAAVIGQSNGWLLCIQSNPVLVSEACSGSGFFLMLVILLAVQFVRRGHSPGPAAAVAIVLAALLTPLVNGVRVIAVIQAHLWLIPLLPEGYQPFLHMLTGVAVFLPGLILINTILEYNEESPAREP